ncbi:substrate-binding domain-containing protein [Coraliomargarita akajimensis]|nr:substrate-binding domain-containing protein [Coraliomargarita akajimensis]
MPLPTNCPVGDRRTIGVVTNPHHSFGRSILRGVNAFIEERGLDYTVDVYFHNRTFKERELSDCAGLIAAVDDAVLRGLPPEFPALNLNGEHRFVWDGSFRVNDCRVGELAAEFFRTEGVRSYLYYDPFEYSNNVGGKQATTRRSHGFQTAHARLSDSLICSSLTVGTADSALNVAEWLRSAPKPIGVLCFNDFAAIEFLEICRSHGIVCPDEVLVVGVDNDDMLCRLAYPTTTSIDSGIEQIAYNAVQAVVRCIEDGVKDSCAEVQPTLVHRESTGTFVTNEPTVLRAIELVNHALPSALTPIGLAEKLGCSERVLNLSLKRELNLTAKGLIVWSLERQAKTLLRETNRSLESIAEAMGRDAKYLHQLLKRSEGCSPGAYRQQFRQPTSIASPKSTVTIGPQEITIGLISSLGRSERSILAGIEHYIRAHRKLRDIRILPRFESVERPVGRTGLWRLATDFFEECSGLIVASDCELPEGIGKRMPVVLIDHCRGQDELWPVFSENLEIGAMAARYFIRRGYQHFAYSGYSPEVLRAGLDFENSAHEQRRLGFEQELHRHGFTHVARLDCSFDGSKEAERWLAELEKPVGLFTHNDYLAKLRLNEAQRIGIRVPEEIAILGVDNDEVFCRSTYPSISSIDIAFVKAGYEITHFLSRMIHCPSEEASGLSGIKPMRVVERGSTNAYGFADPDLVTAMQSIKERCTDAISVDDIVASTALSRRSIESRSKAHLGLALHDMLCYERTQLAIELLTSSAYSVKEISSVSGFESLSAFFRVFKAFTGASPAEYRASRLIAR